MKIYKTKQGNYSFNKSEYSPVGKIKVLYDLKLEIQEEKQGYDLTKDQRKAYITNDPFGSYLRLRRAKELDPRYPHIQFKGRDEATIALINADRLHKMSKEEFLYSGMPYTLIDDIGSYAFTLITN